MPITTPRPWPRRRLLTGLAIAAAAIGLAGCASGPRTVTLGETELNLLLSRQMPVEKRVLELFELRASEPQLQLLPQENRLKLSLKLQWRERLSGKEGQAPVQVDFGLRYDEPAHAIRIQQVRLREPGAASGQLSGRLLRALAESWLEGQALYRFKEEDLQRASALGLRPSAVTVTARGVEITLAKY